MQQDHRPTAACDEKCAQHAEKTAQGILPVRIVVTDRPGRTDATAVTATLAQIGIYTDLAIPRLNGTGRAGIETALTADDAAAAMGAALIVQNKVFRLVELAAHFRQFPQTVLQLTGIIPGRVKADRQNLLGKGLLLAQIQNQVEAQRLLIGNVQREGAEMATQFKIYRVLYRQDTGSCGQLSTLLRRGGWAQQYGDLQSGQPGHYLQHLFRTANQQQLALRAIADTGSALHDNLPCSVMRGLQRIRHGFLTQHQDRPQLGQPQRWHLARHCRAAPWPAASHVSPSLSSL